MSPYVIVSWALITLSVVNFKDGLAKLIVNGRYAKITEVPYQVSLRDAISGSHTCGGSILNSMWILTAAHCIETIDPREFTVQYGVTTIASTGPNIVRVSRIVVHPRYYRPTIIHDIALIRLQTPIKFSSSAQPVRLPNRYQPTTAGIRAILAGWGRNANGIPMKHLQKVDLTIVSKQRCSAIYSGQTQETNICAGSEDIKGACMGDSGGALVANGVQVGIVSFSYLPCAWFPAVYTEVSNYIDWIENTLKNG